MKKEMKRIGRWLLGITATLLLAGCMVDDYKEDIPENSQREGEVDVLLTMKLPGNMSSATKGTLDKEKESKVQTVELLVFEPESKGGTYRYTVYADITDEDYSSETSTITFEAKLSKDECDIVVLANARDIILSSTKVTTSNSKEVVLSSLVVPENSDGKWINESYKPIPMAGFIGEIDLATEKPSAVTLIRMLSRINVTLTDEAYENFIMTDVYLYNPYTSGRLVPDMDNLEKEGEHPYTKVTAPTLPSGELKREEPVHYPIWTYVPQDGLEETKEFVGMIYTFESPQGVDAEEEGMLDNTLLILGGYYGGNLNQKTYYKVDFHNTENNLGYLPLLRNHSYEVGIKKVSGPGFTDKEDALNSKPMNIEAGVLEWNDGEMSEVVFDGRYMLSVSQGEFRLPRDEMKDELEQNQLMVYTDYDVEPNAGWKIDKIVDDLGEDISEAWLSVHRWEGPAGVKTPVYLYLEDNEGAGFRVGYIHISAGRLNYVVKVEQTDEPEINLKVYEILSDGSRVEITDLVFSAYEDRISPREFVVEWAPVRGDFMVSESEIGNTGLGFAYDETGGSGRVELGLLNYPGTYSCTLFPTGMNLAETDPEQGGHAFLEKSSRIDFTINNGVSYLTKSLYLRQVNYGITFEGNKNVYLMDGKEHHFIVKSNTTWKAEVWRDTDHVITNLKTLSGGNSTNTGQMVRF